MKKEYLKLLGKQVLPLVKRSQYGIANWDTSGQYNYLSGEARQRHCKRVIDDVVKEQRKENKEQVWEVWAIKVDGTFELRSDYGYSQDNVSRSSFRVIN